MNIGKPRRILTVQRAEDPVVDEMDTRIPESPDGDPPPEVTAAADERTSRQR